MDLFESQESGPLASRMRPHTFDGFVGQGHLVDEGRLLRKSIESDQLGSLIFHGPPGTGKTTLARIIAHKTQSRFSSLNAVLSGVSEIRGEIAEAREILNFQGKKSILFVDEVHRWNKSQQDALLPWVENGTITLIGATTENPYFEVNKALVSRSRVLQLFPLHEDDLKRIAKMALQDEIRGYGKLNVELEEGALEHLVAVCGGDARNLLNAMEMAVESSVKTAGERIYISLEDAAESIRRRVPLYDKDGDYHYDCISAFIKSIRGSDPDASLYWLARMIHAGEDPHHILRRMLISACEDVGLASPLAIRVVESCAAGFDRVGMPEGQYLLAHAVLYLSTCPKSNSTLGYFRALEAVKKEADSGVPGPLKDSHRDKEGLGDGVGYKYPHDWPEHWVAQDYLPDSLKGWVFYEPGELGYEAKVHQQVLQRRQQAKRPR